MSWLKRQNSNDHFSLALLEASALLQAAVRPARLPSVSDSDKATTTGIGSLLQYTRRMLKRNDLIFLSWGGRSSENVASTLQPILQSHFPSRQVFFSRTSIAIGEDPLKRMLDEGLLKAKVLIAVLTKDSGARPWVVWETATVWAKGGLVVPIFVDLSPGEVPGPLAVRVQGARIRERQEVDRALGRIANAVGGARHQVLSDEEWQQLTASVEAESARTAISTSVPQIPAEFSQRTLPLDDGLHAAGTLLAIEVTARSELHQAHVVMTSVTGPPDARTMSAPARLYWHPGNDESTTLPEGGSGFIKVVRAGPMPPRAVMDSPDHSHPWVLPNGAWHVELQLTVEGYSARHITADFNVHSDGILSQGIEWTDLEVSLLCALLPRRDTRPTGTYSRNRPGRPLASGRLRTDFMSASGGYLAVPGQLSWPPPRGN